MTITYQARCDGHGCRHSTKADVAGHVPAGWRRSGSLHACCATCQRDIDARRARQGFERLQWEVSNG